MNADELLHIIRMGETSTVQFKERMDDAYKLGCELTAFSNSFGGQLLSNTLLFDNAIYLLPYTGIGSGILRTIRYDCDVEFRNEPTIHEFVVIFWRSNQQGEKVTIKSNYQEPKVTIKSNYQKQKVTIKSNDQEEKVTIKNSGMSLSMRQKQVIDYCSIPRTAQEIMDFLEISNQSKNRKKYIITLVEMGVLEMTIPSFPKDKRQKYKKV